ncbi:MAG: tripartite tricarboxylate transporter substrate-binding protein [Armatimonadetes bacterium]|nr:tripartite tricarboxylate transporter substrate-binding protein [Armatimonadota bacterium]MDW8029552.1 tripartite tricarboxylate transporter substrate-binding protein [Armatimonadota bacterium]
MARRTIELLMLANLLGLWGCYSQVEGPFPNRQITIVCPPAPGGISDTLTRALAATVQPILGVPVIVENKPGGANAVGLTYGAYAKPDGYTVTYLVAELAILPHLNLSVVTVDDFDLLARTNYNPAAVTVRADGKWRTLHELIAYAKENPKQVRVGNSGTGSIWHLAAAALQEAGGVEFKHVPFAGAALAVQALLGEHVDVVCVSPTEVQSHVEAGKLRMLAIMAKEKDPLFPKIPTAKELGYDLDIGAWGGLAVPKGTPTDVKEKLLSAFRKAIRDPKLIQMMTERGIRLAWLEGEEFKKFIKNQSEQNRRLIASLGLQLTAGDVGFHFFPRLLLVAIVILSGLLVIEQKGKWLKVSRQDISSQWLMVKGMFTAGLTFAYIVALNFFGFLWATVPFLLFAVLNLKRERLGIVIAVAILGAGLIWFLFARLLKVPLP